MAKHSREGNDVFLLTLTKGGATKQRFKFDYSIEEMGDVRQKEMGCVKTVLGLAGLKIYDLPDSGLKDLDPRIIEKIICDEIAELRPNIIVTYPVHGISGFHDHLVTHAVVKSSFVKMKEKIKELKRLAFITLTKELAEKSKHFRLNYSTESEIDCIEEVEDIDIQKNLEALDCYKTFLETIEKSGVKEMIQKKVVFEFFDENYDPPTNSLFADI